MCPSSDVNEIRQHLQRLGITVPESDLPFLQRTRARQIAVKDQWSALLPPDGFAALVFPAVSAQPARAQERA